MRNASCFSYPSTALTVLMLLSACGGGSGGGVSSTPTPAPTPAPPPINYNTSEYRNSTAAYFDKAITAYEAGATGAGITVGIIDTGIDVNSAEFSGRISSDSAAYGGNVSIADEDGHGTAVAGILAAARNDDEIMGVAFDATIMALRTDQAGTCGSSDDCSFYESDIAAALNHATDKGAQIVNISLGGGGGISTTLRQAVDRATRAGVIIVVSAGNERTEPAPAYDPNNPSPFASEILAAGNGLVVIVNSVDLYGAISSFSDLAGSAQNSVIGALGEDVRSLDLENDPNTYYTYSGTSFAAPQVAGALALLAQYFPNLSSAQLLDLLLGSATDAGDAGTDSIYGRGILNIAAAFAPLGATTLGNSATAISLTSNGTLSSAMGDAGATTTQAVAIDRLGRAYTISLQRSLSPGAPRAVLTPLRYGAMHQGALSIGKFSAAMSFADRWTFHDRSGQEVVAMRPGTASGELTLPLSKALKFAVSFNRHGQDMAENIPVGAENSFLSARGSERELGFTALPASAMLLSYRLGQRWTMTLGAESGRLGYDDLSWTAGTADPRRTHRPQDRYDLAALSFGWRGEGIRAVLTGTLMQERNSLLGARMADFFGVNGAATLFADARIGVELPARWTLSLATRHGWTRATGGGSASLHSMAWDAALSRDGIFHMGDRFDLRLAQPLRVESGGVDAWLPIAHDYATGQSLWQNATIALSPSGREMDAEWSYARPFAGGWLSLNSYARRQPGHIAYAPTDLGAALRFSVGY